MYATHQDTVPGRFESMLWQDASAPAVVLKGPNKPRTWIRAAIEHRAAQYLAAGVVPKRPARIAIGRGSPVDTLALCWLALAHGHTLTTPERADVLLSAGDQIPRGVKPATYSVKSRIHPEMAAVSCADGELSHRELVARLEADPSWSPLGASVSRALRTLLTGAAWVLEAPRYGALPHRQQRTQLKDVSTAA